MGDTAIVTTTINRRPASYAEWSRGGTLVVAGDINTPPELAEYITKDLGGIYITPQQQDEWSFSSLIGWRTIQRRNAAIMQAYALKFDYILTVDDDNYPLPDGETFVAQQKQMMGYWFEDTMSCPTGQLNLGVLGSPPYHQRGVPYGILTDIIVRDKAPAALPPTEIVVTQALVLGDPDCDAIERMVNAPNVESIQASIVVTPGCYAAFNSQATMWKRDWAPVMAVLPHIGRYDDIFASFLFHRLARQFNVALWCGTPVVKQERNPHSLINDLRAEHWGMSKTLTFCDNLNTAVLPPNSTIDMAYEELIMASEILLPAETTAFAYEWIKNWRHFK